MEVREGKSFSWRSKNDCCIVGLIMYMTSSPMAMDARMNSSRSELLSYFWFCLMNDVNRCWTTGITVWKVFLWCGSKLIKTVSDVKVMWTQKRNCYVGMSWSLDWRASDRLALGRHPRRCRMRKIEMKGRIYSNSGDSSASLRTACSWVWERPAVSLCSEHM